MKTSIQTATFSTAHQNVIDLQRAWLHLDNSVLVIVSENWNEGLRVFASTGLAAWELPVPRYHQPEMGVVWVGTKRTQYRLYMKAKSQVNPLWNAAMNEERIRQLEEP
jgi:hypothetical protein